MSHAIEQLAYLAATVLFIFSLYWMNAPKTRAGRCKPALPA